ncbi:MAG: hypothetical protein O2923_07235 [Verrucomicrobia bacterium]|nr:hypothetical protein [Verrucomicrobiota bacterium]MDA1087685.1 hypothetical protein [Verrucomicrobiota bacterium]
MAEIMEWIRSHPGLMWGLGVSSVIMFFASLIAIPVLVVRIPEDYFDGKHRELWSWGGGHRLMRSGLRFLKSTLGVVFILAGLAMLILPGQGILTILVGMMLINFPGKYQFERWLVTRRPVARSIDWLRRRADKGPLRVE